MRTSIAALIVSGAVAQSTFQPAKPAPNVQPTEAPMTVGLVSPFPSSSFETAEPLSDIAEESLESSPGTDRLLNFDDFGTAMRNNAPGGVGARGAGLRHGRHTDAGGVTNLLTLMALTNDNEDNNLLPLLLANDLGVNYGGHGTDSFLPLMAAGVLPKENMLPFMMANQFSSHVGGGQYLPLLAATGALSQDELTPFFLSQQLGYGGDLFSMMALSGQIEQDELLPYMLMSGYGTGNHHAGVSHLGTHASGFGSHVQTPQMGTHSNHFGNHFQASQTGAQSNSFGNQLQAPYAGTPTNQFGSHLQTSQVGTYTNIFPAVNNFGAQLQSQPRPYPSYPSGGYPTTGSMTSSTTGLGDQFDLGMWRAAVVDGASTDSSFESN